MYSSVDKIGNMRHNFKDPATLGEFYLQYEDIRPELNTIKEGRHFNYIWNVGGTQKIFIDGVSYDFPEQSIVPLPSYRACCFENPMTIIVWAFNQDFFYEQNLAFRTGHAYEIFPIYSQILFILLNESAAAEIRLIFEAFRQEFAAEKKQHSGNMIVLLLERFILTVSSFNLASYNLARPPENMHLDTLSNFHRSVDKHYRREHQVQFYAGLLNRAPKTLTNLFAHYHHRRPLEIIQDSIISEAKRLLIYTQKSCKEIARELGFQDISYFSNFFLNRTSLRPTVFRKLYFSGSFGPYQIS
jgi:AraC-like DNA-binding protein